MKRVYDAVMADEGRKADILKMLGTQAFKDMCAIVREENRVAPVFCRDWSKVMEFSAFEKWKDVGVEMTIKMFEDFNDVIAPLPKDDATDSPEHPDRLFDPEQELLDGNILLRRQRSSVNRQ